MRYFRYQCTIKLCGLPGSVVFEDGGDSSHWKLVNKREELEYYGKHYRFY